MDMEMESKLKKQILEQLMGDMDAGMLGDMKNRKSNPMDEPIDAQVIAVEGDDDVVDDMGEDGDQDLATRKMELEAELAEINKKLEMEV